VGPIRLASQALDRIPQFMTEMGHVEAAEVSEFNPLSNKHGQDLLYLSGE
jgi:hypothetical protein